MQNLSVIKASAGSGKTYTLAKLYITQLLFVKKNGKLELRNDPGYFQHILAITFTNKATNEMKERIVKELHTLKEAPTESDYYNYFTEECSPQALEGLQNAAAQSLANILFNYSSFKVSTIDSFFQSILRSFARELDRDYNYELTLDNKYATSMATHKFLMSLGKDAARSGKNSTPAETWVKQFIKQKVGESKSWNSIFGSDESSLASFAHNINNEFFRNHMDELRAYLTGTATGDNLKKINDFYVALTKAAEQCRDYIEKTDERRDEFQQLMTQLGIDPSTFYSRRLMHAFYNNGTANIDTIREASVKVKETWFKRGVIPDDTQQQGIKDFFKNHIKHSDYAELLEGMAKKLAFIGLLGEIDKKLEEYREETNCVLISDTNELIGKVINGSETPFIYERVGTWINHFMLDEFQDTSEKQYNNFKPLIQNSLGSGYLNLIIGDSKQAIYRFRNADPSLFRERIDQDFKDYINSQPLDTNWRSHSAVIGFNNEFTGRLIDNFTGCDKLIKSYKTEESQADYIQKVSPSKQGKAPGMVKVHIINEDDSDTSQFDKVTANIAQYLKELHERFAWKDIIILVNRRSDGAAIVSAVLEHNKANSDDPIPIVSGELMLLENSTTVRRIIGMLRFIDIASFSIDEDSDEEVSDIANHANQRRLKLQRQFSALSKFVDKVTEQEKDGNVLAAANAGQLLLESFNEVENEEADNIAEMMTHYATDLSTLLPDQHNQAMTLVNIVESLIGHSLSDIERKKEVIYLHALQNCIMKFAAQRNGGTVREFLRYWDNNKDKITVPDAGGADAITVLTIHASKGLEADCVVVPYANWQLDDSPLEREYWMTGQQWLDEGGSAIFNDLGIALDPGIVPPILAAGKTALRNLNALNHFVDTCDSQYQDLLIDNINKTYVAFTRPRKELHIFALPHRTQNGTENEKYGRHVGTLIADIIMQMKSDGLFQLVAENVYQMGEPMPAAAAKAEEQGEKLPAYAVTQADINVDLPNDPSSMREIGKDLHAVLSRITHAGMLQQVLDQSVRRGIISTDKADCWNRENLSNMLTKKLQQAPYSEWFAQDNTIYNERSLHLGEPKVKTIVAEGVETRITYDTLRPDRIVRRPDGTLIVVDYKFGSRKDEPYSAQVREYMTELSKVTAGAVKGYIWYVTRGECLEVTK